MTIDGAGFAMNIDKFLLIEFIQSPLLIFLNQNVSTSFFTFAIDAGRE